MQWGYTDNDDNDDVSHQFPPEIIIMMMRRRRTTVLVMMMMTMVAMMMMKMMAMMTVHINFLLSDGLPNKPHHQSKLSPVDKPVAILILIILIIHIIIITIITTIIITITTITTITITMMNRPHQRQKMRRRSRPPSPAPCASLSSAADNSMFQFLLLFWMSDDDNAFLYYDQISVVFSQLKREFNIFAFAFATKVMMILVSAVWRLCDISWFMIMLIPEEIRWCRASSSHLCQPAPSSLAPAEHHHVE